MKRPQIQKCATREREQRDANIVRREKINPFDAALAVTLTPHRSRLSRRVSQLFKDGEQEQDALVEVLSAMEGTKAPSKGTPRNVRAKNGTSTSDKEAAVSLLGKPILP